MSLFRRLMVVLGAGGAGYQSELRKDANIFSAYNLCSSVPVEELTASLTSAYSISVLVVELVASMGTTGTLLVTILNPSNVAALASVYDLSTAVT